MEEGRLPGHRWLKGRALGGAVKHVLLSAFRANGLNPALTMPIAVSRLDVYAAALIICRKKHWRVLTMAKPPDHRLVSRRLARRGIGG